MVGIPPIKMVIGDEWGMVVYGIAIPTLPYPAFFFGRPHPKNGYPAAEGQRHRPQSDPRTSDSA